MQINRRRMLKQMVLSICCRHHVRMTMPDADGDDPAERVEIPPPVPVPDVLHFSFHQHDWLFVVEKNSRVEEFAAQTQDFVGGRSAVFGGLMIEWRKVRRVHVVMSC